MLKRLLTLILVLGLTACSALPRNTVAPKVNVADVSVKSMTLLEQKLDVGLRISNPNDFDLTIVALEFEMEVNGRPFAHGLSRKSTTIPAVASALLRIDTFTQSKDLFRQFMTLTPKVLKDGVPYRVKGRFKTDRSSYWQDFDHSSVYGGDEKTPEGKAI
jgi:LEA14-like dessication related protein